jgi:hypothetical protein
VIGVYRANLRLIRALAGAYGFVPVFFWQPTIASKKIKSPDEERWARDVTRDPESRVLLHEAIIAERRRCRELANASDAIDLSALFDGCAGPVYIDLYHLSEPANAAVAEAMLPAVAAAATAALRRRRQE